MKKSLIFFFILTAAAFLPAKSWAQDTVELWITHQFTGATLLEKKIPLNGESVMELLEKNAEIKTAFGGGFVTEINSLAQDEKEKKYWLYYINGILAQVGARGYFPKANDVIWWNYQSDGSGMVSFAVGAFPQPFLGGYNAKVPSTVIFAAQDFSEIAHRLKTNLEKLGGKEVLIAGDNRSSNEKPSYQIHIGTLVDLAAKKILSDMDASGVTTGAALIFTINSDFGPLYPRWIITGTNNDQIRKAVDLIIAAPEKLKFYSSVAVVNGAIIASVRISKGKIILQ